MQVMSTAFPGSPSGSNASAQNRYVSSSPENDELQQLLKEDEQLFMEKLFKTYFSFVCKTIYRIVPDTATAEDLAQEVFIKIWNRRAALEQVYFRAYLQKAAINMALDHLDKNKRRGAQLPLEENLAPQQAAPQGQSLNQTARHIQQAIDKLPEKCRQIFVLSRYEELSYREIATTLNISVKTVENQMITALKKLRVSLQEYLTVLVPFIFLSLSLIQF
jgi:RNA polymerase sigma-70 factor (family 1)